MLSVFFIKFLQILNMSDNFNEKLEKTKVLFWDMFCSAFEVPSSHYQLNNPC